MGCVTSDSFTAAAAGRPAPFGYAYSLVAVSSPASKNSALSDHTTQGEPYGGFSLALADARTADYKRFATLAATASGEGGGGSGGNSSNSTQPTAGGSNSTGLASNATGSGGSGAGSPATPPNGDGDDDGADAGAADSDDIVVHRTEDRLDYNKMPVGEVAALGVVCALYVLHAFWVF
ncbi:hypothetical protein B0T26DRAFT_721326 [Lasiosphaeria miniovina]|uniref:Uncharacterized protein n=1 Tax=Lasiosphaeria miniovina TaxID=1954250 RepID=A0AA40DRK1_9PEZI|nr:uncharacterized protein B0T26DRAFT_721326 [Lasiosphaeria miniovina]KAK0709383.1 hypothetical protein B0T26DRAFT_721326 [Lasiosphaeria miniovina]